MAVKHSGVNNFKHDLREPIFFVATLKHESCYESFNIAVSASANPPVYLCMLAVRNNYFIESIVYLIDQDLLPLSRFEDAKPTFNVEGNKSPLLLY